MASQDAADQDFDAPSRRNKYMSPVEEGSSVAATAGEDDPFPGFSGPYRGSDILPSLRIDSGTENSWDSSRTPSRTFSSRNPFRRPSPIHLFSDLTSEASTSPLQSPLSASQIQIQIQIQMEELETERLELELKLRKINLRKQKLQREERMAQEKLRLEAERQAQEQKDRKRLEVEKREQMKIEAERLERERLAAERQEQLRADAERAEQERAEAQRVEQLRLDAERKEREEAEKLKRWLEEKKKERLEAERKERERIENERKESLRLEQEREAAKAREQERLDAERARAETERLERQKSARIALERRQQIERERLEEQLHRQQREPASQISNLDAGSTTENLSISQDAGPVLDRTGSISPISTEDARDTDAPKEKELPPDEDLDPENINPEDPGFQERLRDAMKRHMPPDESDVISKGPPVPPKPFKPLLPVSIVPSFPGFDNAEEERCSCGKVKLSAEECYFCWPCNGTIFCKECWDSCPPHKKKRMPVMNKSTGSLHEVSTPEST
jgi:hypothetical protein